MPSCRLCEAFCESSSSTIGSHTSRAPDGWLRVPNYLEAFLICPLCRLNEFGYTMQVGFFAQEPQNDEEFLGPTMMNIRDGHYQSDEYRVSP